MLSVEKLKKLQHFTVLSRKRVLAVRVLLSLFLFRILNFEFLAERKQYRGSRHRWTVVIVCHTRKKPSEILQKKFFVLSFASNYRCFLCFEY